MSDYWIAEAVKMLRELHDAGKLSATQIAAALSERFGPTTKNAVIGKWNRLGLGGRKPPKPSKRKPADCAQKSSFVAKEQEAVKPVYVPSKGKLKMDVQSFFEPAPVDIPVARISLLDLRETTCRFPLGDPGSDDFAFCGNYAPIGKPYCSHHQALAWRPAQRLGNLAHWASSK